MNQTSEALNLLKQNSEKQIPKGYLTEFFTDWNLIASSPRPPQGIQEFISKAKEMLNYEKWQLKKEYPIMNTGWKLAQTFLHFYKNIITNRMTQCNSLTL